MLLERYGPPALGAGALNALRLTHRVPMSAEARRRAHDQRAHVGATGVTTPEQKLETDGLRARLRELTRERSLYEIIGQRFLAAAREIPSLPPPRPPKLTIPKGLDEEEMVLMISDVQAGSVLGAKDSGGLAEFNSAILIDQIDYLAQSIASIKRYNSNVKRLRILYGGDIVDGETIFPGQLREIEMNSVQQVMFVVEHFARFNWQMANLFEQVWCTGVIGNHGRIGKKGEHDPMSNLDHLAYQWMAERNRPVKNITWSIPATWWSLIPIQGWNFLLVHGDDVGGGYAGIPFYGAGRSKARYQDMLRVTDRMQGRRHTPTTIDYFCIGHFSEPAEFYECIMNGSWPGGTEFSAKRLQRTAMPTQALWAVHHRHGMTWKRNVQLRPLP